MAEPRFLFDKSFQSGILSLMLTDYNFLLSAQELIKPEYFEDNVLVWFFKTIKEYNQDYKQTPTIDVIWNELIKDVKSGRIKDLEQEAFIETFQEIQNPVSSKNYLIDEVIKFCRRQELKKTILEVAPLLHKDDQDIFDEVEAKIHKACTVGSYAKDIGTMYFSEYRERLRKREEGTDLIRIPTGITDLDHLIGGGVKAGQICIWIGGTSSGKSIVLPHCGKRAVIEGNNVVHYTLELNEDDVAERYDASWTNTNVNDLLEKQEEVRTKLGDCYSKYGDNLIIKFWPSNTATIKTIRAHLTQVVSTGFIPDLVIVDYLDLIKPETNYNDLYSDLGVITADLRGIAGEFNVPLITATQTNRSGQNVEIVELEHMGDSFRKCQIADIILGICCNKEEAKENIARIYIDKNRNGPKNREVKIKTDYARMCFYAPAATAALPPEEPKKEEKKKLTITRKIPLKK